MNQKRIIRTYSELIQLSTFEERFEYLKIGGSIGIETFGHDRYLNQKFYTSKEWRRFRNDIIIRDNGCDLGIEGLDIYGPIFIHHINPINIEDLLENRLEFAEDTIDMLEDKVDKLQETLNYFKELWNKFIKFLQDKFFSSNKYDDLIDELHEEEIIDDDLEIIQNEFSSNYSKDDDLER